MKIRSPIFSHNGIIPVKYSCDEEGASPPLQISEMPAEAKSLALIVDDPDAPATGGFVHWVAFNIDPSVNTIEENSAPPGAVEGMNSFGKAGYVSPCPPSGTHRYQFKLYALDTMLKLDSSAGREDVERAMEGHILSEALLVGLYKRQ